jgi:DNA-binding beta-propeller fold protein YncE
VFSGDNRYLYASSWESHALYRVDVASRQVVDTLLGIGNARSMLFTPDGNRLLVGASLYVFSVRPDSLSILDTTYLPSKIGCMTLNRAGTVLYVGMLHGLCVVDVQGCSLLASTQTVYEAQHVVLSPDEESLYVHSHGDSGVAVLRASDLSVTRRVNMGIIAAGHLALTPDGAYLYVGNGYEGSLVCDTRSLMRVDSVDVPGMGELVIHPSGDSAYYASSARLYVIGKRR